MRDPKEVFLENKFKPFSEIVMALIQENGMRPSDAERQVEVWTEVYNCFGKL